MKRCPQCDFQYLDSDQFCDLDGSTLTTVETSTATQDNQERPKLFRQGWKSFALLLVPGIVFGAILLLVYNQSTNQRKTLASDHEANAVPSPQSTPRPEPSIEESPNPTPEPTNSPVAKPSPARSGPSTTAKLSSRPVSTESSEKDKRQKIIIRLNDGGTIAADEAWRTKDGIWYRHNGLVTLLKRNQVKAIEKAP